MKTPTLANSLEVGLLTLALTGCETNPLLRPDISERVDRIICETSIPGGFTTAGALNLDRGVFQGGGKKIDGRVEVADVQKGGLGYWEYQGGLLPGHTCGVEGRLPKALASFDPRKKDIVVSDKGNLHFKPTDPNDLADLTKTYPVPNGLRRNDGEDWNHLWVIDPQVGENDQDHQYLYEVADNDQVHGGFIETVEALAQGGFGARLEVSSYATLYEQGESTPMTLNKFLAEVK